MAQISRKSNILKSIQPVTPSQEEKQNDPSIPSSIPCVATSPFGDEKNIVTNDRRGKR